MPSPSPRRAQSQDHEALWLCRRRSSQNQILSFMMSIELLLVQIFVLALACLVGPRVGCSPLNTGNILLIFSFGKVDVIM